MDVSMEILEEDSDDNEDTIKEYLKGKIEEAKSISKATEKNIKDLQDYQKKYLQYLQKSEYSESKYVEIKNSWQKIFNDKWIIGISLENSARSAAENVNVILKSNSKSDLTYASKIYTLYEEEIPEDVTILEKTDNPIMLDLIQNIKSSFGGTPEWIPTQTLKKTSTIVVISDVPNFIQMKELEIEGILLFDMFDETYQMKLPKFCIKVEEVLSNELLLKWDGFDIETEEFLFSILSSSIITAVKIIMPDDFNTLEEILQMDCCFKKVKTMGFNDMYIFYENNHKLKYCILKIFPEKTDIELYTSNNEQLCLLFHHLYKNIPDVLILDEHSEQINENSIFGTKATQSFFEPSKMVDQTVLNEFINSFDQQIAFIQSNETIKTCNEGSSKNVLIIDDYKEFRKKLSEFEKQTDELYVKILNKK